MFSSYWLYSTYNMLCIIFKHLLEYGLIRSAKCIHNKWWKRLWSSSIPIVCFVDRCLSFFLLKGCIRLATASDKVYQLLAGWFSPGTLASSTTKTGRHDIAEILLKVVLNSKNIIFFLLPLCCLSFCDLRILITPLVSSTLLIPHNTSIYCNP
jgi:hypothetical protein